MRSMSDKTGAVRSRSICVERNPTFLSLYTIMNKSQRTTSFRYSRKAERQRENNENSTSLTYNTSHMIYRTDGLRGNGERNNGLRVGMNDLCVLQSATHIIDVEGTELPGRINTNRVHTAVLFIDFAMDESLRIALWRIFPNRAGILYIVFDEI